MFVTYLFLHLDWHSVVVSPQILCVTLTRFSSWSFLPLPPPSVKFLPVVLWSFHLPGFLPLPLLPLLYLCLLPLPLSPPLDVISCISHLKLCRCVCWDFYLSHSFLPFYEPSYKSNQGSTFKKTKAYRLASKSYISELNPKLVCRVCRKTSHNATSCNMSVLKIHIMHFMRQLTFYRHRSNNSHNRCKGLWVVCGGFYNCFCHHQ